MYRRPYTSARVGDNNMTKETKTAIAPTEQPVATGDLSEAIDGSIEKMPGEEVRSVRVYEDYYRCNWWVQDASPGPMYLNVGRITRSKFLRATMSGEKLVIEDMSSRPQITRQK
jgi:hypothetical protein